MSSPWAHGDPRAIAHAILADPRYHAADKPTAKSLWDIFWEWVGHWFDRLFGGLHISGGGNAGLALFLGYLVLAAVIVGVVAVVLLVLPPGTRFAARRGRRGGGHVYALADEGDAMRLRGRAREAAAAGRYREAAGFLWASALHALDELGRVRYDPARTPGEWRRAVRDPAFDGLTRDAVVALFGDHEPDATLVARMDAAYDAALGVR
ncbi:MAG TPA: DUF4129 domain-containing protein [Candidatus Elarobacter sp.]